MGLSSGNSARLSNDAGHWDKLWIRLPQQNWDTLSEEVFHTLRTELGDLQGLWVLEAGSGTGRISARLAENGAQVTLVDFSLVALSQSKARFESMGLDGKFIQARIEKLPLGDDLYDAVWSAGVLEHYSDQEQINQLKELVRILKPGGLLITLVPAAGCLLYRVYKWFAEATGTWPYGYERPLHTLLPHFGAAGLTDCREYTTAFNVALEIGNLIPGAKDFVSFLRFWYSGLPLEERQRCTGYLLVTIGRKPGVGRMTQVSRPLTQRYAPQQKWQIVVLAGVDYEYLFQRPQQLAKQFSSLGYRTIYVQSTPVQASIQRDRGPSDLGGIVSNAILRLTHWHGEVAVTSAITHLAIEGATPIPVLPVWLRSMIRLFDLDRPLFWVTHQGWGHAVGLLKQYGFVVYDCVDELSAFRGATYEALAGERLLMENADMISVASRALLQSREQLHPRVHLIPNGVNVEDFIFCRRPTPRQWPVPVAGFVGALAYWVDTELLAQVARALPSWTFVLVGPHEGASLEVLKGLPNVVLTGRVEYSEVPKLLRQFDVGMVPFKVTDFTDNANPIKIYEYLAAGLPVVSTPIKEVKNFRDLVLVADGPEEFASALVNALMSDNADKVRRRVRYATMQSWKVRASVAAALATVYDTARRSEREAVAEIVADALKECWDNADMKLQIAAGIIRAGLVEGTAVGDHETLHGLLEMCKEAGGSLAPREG